MFGRRKKYYWFEVRYIYSNDKQRLFDWVTQIGVDDRSKLLNRRLMKKIPKPCHLLNNKQIKNLLCNGHLDIEINCFLGHFSKK